MNKLYVLLLVIALVPCVACQRQQAQEQQTMTQRDSSASPSTSPEKPSVLQSQAQKFKPRRIVPMASPIRETPPSTPASSESPNEELSKNDTANQKNDREEAAQGREGLPRLSTPAEETLPIKGEVPQRILDPILNEAAALANVPREQLVIVRAESVVWNDGSLGCPEPGMEYAQVLVNGYWVVISAAGHTYDFRVGRDGSFRLCPQGAAHPPLPSDVR